MIRAALALAVVSIAGCAGEPPDFTPRVLATGESASYSLVFGDDALYWGGNDGLRRLSVGDDTATTIGEDTPVLGIAVDGEDVFWAAPDGIMAARADGSDERRLVDGQRCVFSMAVDDEYVYWGSIIDEVVWAWNRNTGRAHHVAIDERNVTGLAVYDGRVYWSAGAGHVASARPDGSDRRTLARDLDWPRSVAVADGEVYWVNADGSIGRTSDDGPTVTMATTDRVSGIGMVLTADRDGVYWVTQDSTDAVGAVYALGRSDSEATPLATAAATAVASDGDDVYWATYDGDIVARRKP